MIIGNLYFISIIIIPHEANSPLIVYLYAVLSIPIAAQFFQVIGWRIAQIINASSVVQ
jgi:hypothetical protein